MPKVIDWIELSRPEILCLQETKMKDSMFPYGEFESLGYQSAHFGNGQWNGVAILSRVGLENPIFAFSRDDPDMESDARIVSADCGGLKIFSVYVPNGRSLTDEHYQFKLRWLADLREHLQATCNQDDEVAVCGDFNIAPDDRDVWDIAAMEGMTHVSPREREALADIEDWGLTDSFRIFNDEGGLYSWWDYRGGSFHKGIGMRIDLILVSAPLARRCLSSVIDRNARKGPQPSDHAPVVLEFL